MSIIFSNARELVDFSFQQKLYKLLLEQLEKDFNYSGIEMKIRKNCAPENLVDSLQSQLKLLIMNDFTSYLNLLYRIDVSEHKIKKVDGSDLDILAQQVCFLILEREWIKVWYRFKSMES